MIVKHPCCGLLIMTIVLSAEEPHEQFEALRREARSVQLRCQICGGLTLGTGLHLVKVEHQHLRCWPLEWMKRLPPLGQEDAQDAQPVLQPQES